MRKSTFIIYISLLFVSGCIEHTPQEEPENRLIFKLQASHEEQNIYEMVTFHLLTDDQTSLNDVAHGYDSIVWSVPALNGRFNIYKPSSEENPVSKFTFRWGHNFFIPGYYDTYLIGYKEKQTIYHDTLSVSIVDTKDFLRYNWNNIILKDHCEGFMDLFSKNERSVRTILNKNTPGIRLFLWNTPADSDKILADYMTSLYSEPTYTTSYTQLLQEKYEELFLYKMENAQPITIWITPKSKIVLLKFDPKENHYEYEIYAEPLNNI